MNMSQKLRAIVEPLVDDLGLDLYDLEHHHGTVRVTLDSAGGVASERLTEASRLISRALDEADPIESNYTLEVSSPGLERTLRTSEHYELAVGEMVTIKTKPSFDGERRVRGVLRDVTSSGIVVAHEDEQFSVPFDDILSTKTLFEWESGADRTIQKAGDPS